MQGEFSTSLKFMENFLIESDEKRVTTIDTGDDQAVDQCKSRMGQRLFILH